MKNTISENAGLISLYLLFSLQRWDPGPSTGVSSVATRKGTTDGKMIELALESVVHHRGPAIQISP